MYYLILIVLLFSLIYRVYHYRTKNFWKDNVFKINFSNSVVIVDRYSILFSLLLVYIYFKHNNLEFIILSVLILFTFVKYVKK